MELSRVAPELQAPMRRVTRISIPMERAWARRVTQTLLAVMPAMRADGLSIEQPRDAEPSVRVYRPAAQRSPAASFWIHGGGLIIGRAVQDDRLCGLTARELGIVVVSVEYRLAPEHPFPAASLGQRLYDDVEDIEQGESKELILLVEPGSGLAALCFTTMETLARKNQTNIAP